MVWDVKICGAGTTTNDLPAGMLRYSENFLAGQVWAHDSDHFGIH